MSASEHSNFHFQYDDESGALTCEVPGRYSEYDALSDDFIKESHLLKMASVLSIQALGMRILRDTNQSFAHRTKRHMFAKRNADQTRESEAYSDTIEEYFSFRVAKVALDHWKMRVSFRKNVLSLQSKAQTDVDDYEFQWSRNDNVQARFAKIHIEDLGSYSKEHWYAVTPIDEDVAEALRERMLRHHDVNKLQQMYKLSI